MQRGAQIQNLFSLVTLREDKSLETSSAEVVVNPSMNASSLKLRRSTGRQAQATKVRKPRHILQPTLTLPVAAVIIFGDTRHTADQPYNFGNGSSYDGLFPRPQSQISALEAYAGVMRNWCLEVLLPPLTLSLPRNPLANHTHFLNSPTQSAPATTPTPT